MGKISYLELERASFAQYSQDKLIIYSPILRNLNDEEKSILKEADNRNLEDYLRNKYLIEQGFGYLLGIEKEKGENMIHILRRYWMITSKGLRY